jgi:Mrp family chromosome partitioning ATPase
MQAMRTNTEASSYAAYANGNGHQHHNLQLLLASLQNGGQKLRAGVTLVLTSPSHGEGVSHVAQLFAVELARHTGRRTLIIAAERLRGLRVQDYLSMPDNCHRTNIENVWMLPAKKRVVKNGSNGEGNGNGNGNGTVGLMPVRIERPEAELNGLDPIDSLRVSFDNILIDCPPLKDSSDAAVLASSADGVVVVAEAGRTRRAEIVNAQRTINVSGGKLLGFVLNKRRYHVPEWLYKRL